MHKPVVVAKPRRPIVEGGAGEVSPVAADVDDGRLARAVLAEGCAGKRKAKGGCVRPVPGPRVLQMMLAQGDCGRA
mgnify:CR=1 FL=1